MPDPATAGVRVVGTINVKTTGQPLGGDNNFIAGGSYVRVFSDPVNGNDVTHKQYVDAQSAKVPVGNSTPSGISVGSMWFNTTDNCLYIKKS